jgi:hypothetical protein
MGKEIELEMNVMRLNFWAFRWKWWNSGARESGTFRLVPCSAVRPASLNWRRVGPVTVTNRSRGTFIPRWLGLRNCSMAGFEMKQSFESLLLSSKAKL